MLISPRYDGPPILTIDGPADDQLAPTTRQRRRLEAMLRDLTDDQWRSPSRCDSWTVQDVVAHVVGVNEFWALSVSAGLAGEPTRILGAFDPAATPPLMVDAMRALTPAETLERFVASNDAILGVIAGLDTDGWLTNAESPAGHVPIRLVMHHALWDCWVHERDIALPLGLAPAIEADEVVSSLRYAAAVSPALAISVGTSVTGSFAVDAHDPDARFTLEVSDSVAVRDTAAPDDAPCLRGNAVELLEALSIRIPLPSVTPPEWRRVLGGLAAAFDTEWEPA
jgi:uncharacterized protein (TIGR03083 family)